MGINWRLDKELYLVVDSLEPSSPADQHLDVLVGLRLYSCMGTQLPPNPDNAKVLRILVDACQEGIILEFLEPEFVLNEGSNLLDIRRGDVTCVTLSLLLLLVLHARGGTSTTSPAETHSFSFSCH